MSIHEHIIQRPWSNPEDASFQAPTGPGTVDDSLANLSLSGQSSLSGLPYLQRAKSSPLQSSNAISDSHSRTKRPSFKIELPPSNPSMLLVRVPKVIPRRLSDDLYGGDPNDQTVTVVQQSLLSTFLSPSHLTPPEESLVSPVEAILARTLPASSVPTAVVTQDTASMASNKSDDHQHPEPNVSDQDENEITESSEIDLNGIANFAVDQLAKFKIPATAMSMVHQPLPFPLPQRLLNNDPTIITLFSQLVNCLRSDSRLPNTGIQIFHTLMDKLPHENLPTSPPVTPSYLSRNSNQQAQGYFTIKPLYLSVSGPLGLVVPPGGALVSITERMIPPSAEFEISSFLNQAIDSGFSERLSELGQGGVFVLVLPTEAGGHTFHKEYLSKLLDPILRSISVRLGLRSRLATEISNAVALNQLMTFEVMQSKIESLLTSANSLIFPGLVQTQFKLISSQKGSVRLPFEAWYSWWLGQERARIMGLLNYHLNVQGQGVVSGVSRSSIMLELEDSMQEAGAARGRVEAGIELAIYVIQRIS